jgi:hypothetical protein
MDGGQGRIRFALTGARSVAGSGTQEHEAGAKSRRPKPGTAKAATVRDDRDPGEGTPVPLFQPNRGARGRDG